MPSKSYIAQQRKKASRKGRLGARARQQKIAAEGREMQVVGGCTTWGVLGEHTIELLAGDDSRCAWIRVDGRTRTPRTLRGFASILSRWLWRHTPKNHSRSPISTVKKSEPLEAPCNQAQTPIIGPFEPTVIKPPAL